MEDIRLLMDHHIRGNRQGPGGDAETERALDLALVDRTVPLKVADIGCGTGASTMVLAKRLNAQITAVDFLQGFLDVLDIRAEKLGLSEKIRTLCCSMDNLPFRDEAFDVIWSEGAIYNIGFERGVKAWHRYLKVGGLLVVSEITWTTASRPLEVQGYWEAEYPEIDQASSKMRTLEESGYSPVGYFVLPEHCWMMNYYQPILDRFEDFLERNGYSEAARAIVAGEKREIAMYQKFKDNYSYGVYAARKVDQAKP